MDEEVKLKMSLDSKGVSNEMRKVSNDVHQAGEHVHHSFVHATNGARGFHKVMHEMQETSPLLGLAFRASFDGLGALFAAMTLAFGYFHEKLKEVNKELDEMGRAAAKPIGEIKKAMREAENEIENIQREFFKSIHKDDYSTINDINKLLKERIDLLKETGKHYGNTPEIAKKSLALELAMQKEAHMKIVAEQGKLVDEKNKAEADKERVFRSTSITNAKDSIKVDEKRIEELEKSLNEKRTTVENNNGGPMSGVATAIMNTMGSDLFAKMKKYSGINKIGELLDAAHTTYGIGPGSLGVKEDQLKELAKLSEELKGAKDRVEENNRQIDSETMARKIVTEKLNEAQHRLDSANAALGPASDAIHNTRQAINLLNSGKPDTRTRGQIAHDNWLENIHQAERDRLRRVAEQIERKKHTDQPNWHPQGEGTPRTAEQFLSSIDIQMRKINETFARPIRINPEGIDE